MKPTNRVRRIGRRAATPEPTIDMKVTATEKDYITRNRTMRKNMLAMTDEEFDSLCRRLSDERRKGGTEDADLAAVVSGDTLEVIVAAVRLLLVRHFPNASLASLFVDVDGRRDSKHFVVPVFAGRQFCP